MRPGDWVFAEDEKTGEMKLREVLKTFVRFSAPIVAVVLINTTDLSAQTLDTTEEHPFYVEGKGWVPTQSLTPGDAVRTASGLPAIVHEVHFTSRLGTVYNFEVQGLHNYRVGHGGVLVHNISCYRAFTRGNFAHNLNLLLPKPGDAYQAHHIIPHRFQRLFPSRNLNDPTNGAWIHQSVHQGRGSITDLWETWARNNPSPTSDQVEAFARTVEDRAGLWMIRP